MVQETHASKNKERVWRNQWGSQIIFCNGESNARGVMTMFAKGLEYSIEKIEKCEGRVLDLMIRYENQLFNLINVYAPNNDDPDFFVQILEAAQIQTADHTIIGGDFNVVLSELDQFSRSKEKFKISKAANVVNQFLEDNEWIDVWRYGHDNKREFTWKRRNPISMSRLDFFLTPLFTASHVKQCEIVYNVLSDHHFVMIELEGVKQIKGKGYWKFNNSLLRDKTFLDEMNVRLDEINNRKYMGVHNKWEAMKAVMQGFSQEFSHEKALKRNAAIRELERKLLTQEKRLNMINLSAQNACCVIEKINVKIDKIKSELNKEYEHKAQGAIIRTKAKWMAEGEAYTSYYLSLEKTRAKNRTMAAVRTESGDVTRNTVKILNEQAKYYKALYTKDPSVKFTYEQAPKKIMQVTKDELEKEITLEELSIALKEMKPNKSPGISGLTADLFKVFWGKIKQTFYASVLESCKNGCLNRSARKGIITLLPKPNRDILEVKGWRPITLLEIGYKIVSKAIANRLKGSLEEIIHSDQTAFLKGRDISQNVRRICDVMEFSRIKNLAAVIILLDFEKAFDRVDYDCLYKSFEYFGYGKKFIEYIRLMFTNFELCTINAGHFSEYFVPTRGLFQGNPLGPYAFLIMMEVLAIQLRNNPKIEGISVNGLKNIVTQFADDLSLFMRFSQSSWEELIKVLDKFQGNSGMKINYDKTTVYRIGSLAKSNAKFYAAKKLKWTNEPVNVLGIWIDHNQNKMVELNLKPILEKIEGVIKLWSVRGASLIGKIVIVNALINSLLVYRFNVLREIPVAWLEELWKKTKDFIWNKGKAKIPKEILSLHSTSGGLNLCNLNYRDMSLKCKWVVKAMQDEGVRNMAFNLLENKYGDCIWEAQLKKSEAKHLFEVNNFWGDVLLVWLQVNKVGESKCAEIRKQPLMLNSEIKIGDKVYFNKILIEHGITCVEDIVAEKNLFTFEEFVQHYGEIIPRIEYYSIVSAIPGKWKALLKEKGQEEVKIMKDRITSFPKVAKGIYNVLNQVKDETILKFSEKWNRILNMEMQGKEFIKRVNNMYSYTICRKLRSFHFRLMYHAIITNIRLKYMGIKENDKCTFCAKERETYVHLFCECTKVTPLWGKVEELIETELDCKKILLNDVVPNRKRVENTVVLITKYYLFSCKCQGKDINWPSLKAYITKYKETEQKIASDKGKLSQHTLKWSKIIIE